VSGNAILFIDANQYLDLYRMVSGRRLLAALEEQKDYIFVTSQVVSEVSRNKVKVAASFLAEATKKIDLSAMAPDHMFTTMDDSAQQLGRRLHGLREEVAKARDAFRKLTQDLLEQVSQSKDDVSKALAVIFSKAAVPNAEELRRAKDRKVLGNPPGKNNDPLGDQVSWEQILTKCKNKPSVWIITKDTDYATKYDGNMFLNALLYDELARLYQGQPEVFCFDNIADGLKHFSETTSVNAEKLPTPDETEQIKKEQDSLPPLGSLDDSSDVLSTANALASSKSAFDASQYANLFANSKLVSDASQLANAFVNSKFLSDSSQLANAFVNSKFLSDSSRLANAFVNSKFVSDSSQLANVFANSKFVSDASQLANALASFNANATLAASEITNALAGLNAKKTLATSQIADTSAGQPASAKENLTPDETENKKGDG
jgi:hypothetical protein